MSNLLINNITFIDTLTKHSYHIYKIPLSINHETIHFLVSPSQGEPEIYISFLTNYPIASNYQYHYLSNNTFELS